MGTTLLKSSWLPLLALWLCSCGVSKDSLGLTEGITIAMTGTFEAPPDAEGNSDPRFEKVTLDTVTLVESDGTTVDASPSVPKEFTIVSRPQIIAQKDLSSDLGDSFEQIILKFDGTVLVTGKYTSDISVTLPSPTATYTCNFTIQQQKSPRLDISLQWRNTVTRDDAAKSDSASAPAFSFALSGT